MPSTPATPATPGGPGGPLGPTGPLCKAKQQNHFSVFFPLHGIHLQTSSDARSDSVVSTTHTGFHCLGDVR